ncbi:hypothetical protein B5K06_10800 [Rhizobium grahamii]|uniref:Uncharacterized protein n=2 Tax=Rhizobium grahamii TaxID=1120045 RepID=A0A370KR02_9HYPH|nr:hypothetical protein B5K06_10800 [Rhizobium grahamii]
MLGDAMPSFPERSSQNGSEWSNAAERNRHALLLLAVGAGATLVTLLCAALAQGHGPTAGFGVGALIILAGIAVGGLLGFLFSVPRVLAKDTSANVAAAAVSMLTSVGPKGTALDQHPAASANDKGPLLSSNTNLERISEWLTTMLVGVGLTEVDSLGDGFRDFSDFLAERVILFQGTETPAGILPAVGPLLLVAGLVSGFIFFYLYTRIYLSPLFLYVETILSDPGTERLKTEVDKAVREAVTFLPQDSPMITYASQAASLSVSDSLYVITNLLYQTDGYHRAIELGNKLAATSAVKLSRYWYLMAAAYGQKHHYLLGNASAEERRATRDAVLYAARKAVQISDAAKQSLKSLTEATEIDNDLQDFKHDPDFERIVK